MKDEDQELIIEKIAQAALEGDIDRALYLHDCWMVEFTPTQKTELQSFYGDEYFALFESEKMPMQ